MGKVLNFLKKFSFGAYRTGLYTNEAMVFGSVLSVVLSALFLIGLFVGVVIYFNEIFIQRQQYIVKQETKSFKDGYLDSYSRQQALELFPVFLMQVDIPNRSIDKTVCNTISLSFLFDETILYENFTNQANNFCFINLFQNPKMKEDYGDAPGFYYYGGFYYLNQSLFIEGLDSTMKIRFSVSQNYILSNGELLDQSFTTTYIDAFNGTTNLRLNLNQYNKTTSIFEQLFSRLNTQYYLDAKPVDVIKIISDQRLYHLIGISIYPSFSSYLIQPKQFYEIFPLIGALLGLFKIFSFVSLYNEKKFEKELEASLSQQKVKDEEEEGVSLHITLNDDLALNKSTDLLMLQKTHPEIEDGETKLQFKELYSFATFKEMHKNNLLLLQKSKSKEAHLNKHEQRLNNLQDDTQRLENETQRLENDAQRLENETNQKFNTFFEQLSMREEEISDLRTQKDQLQTKITTLEKENSEFRSKIANHDEQNQQIMLMMKQIKEELTIKQVSSKKND